MTPRPIDTATLTVPCQPQHQIPQAPAPLPITTIERSGRTHTSYLVLELCDYGDGLLEDGEFGLRFIVAHVQRAHAAQFLYSFVDIAYTNPACVTCDVSDVCVVVC